MQSLNRFWASTVVLSRVPFSHIDYCQGHLLSHHLSVARFYKGYRVRDCQDTLMTLPHSQDVRHGATDVAEIPYILPARSWSFYAIFLFIVIPLWSAIPIAWSFVIHALWTGNIWLFGWNGRMYFVAAIGEVLFSVHHYKLVRSISGPPPNVAGNLAERQAGFIRSYDEESLDDARPGSPAEAIVQLNAYDPRAIDFRERMRAWYRNASLESLTDRQRALLDEALSCVEKRAGKTIPDEPTVGVQPARLTIDEVNVNWRPLTWYLMVLGGNWMLKHWLVTSYGVRFGCYNGLEYFVRIPGSWDSVRGRRPLVTNFFLSDLLRTHSDRPLLFPLQPHISQNIFHPRFLTPMPRGEMTTCIVGLLQELGWVPPLDELDDTIELERKTKSMSTGVVMLSHSYGSFVHAWFLKAYPHMVVRSCFVDPVAICCWEGDMCHNFIYKPCTTGSDLLMRYFVGTELGVANTLQRHFDWVSNSLWFEDVPNAQDPDKTLVVLGGRDAILNAERVRRYLSTHGVSKGIYFDPNGAHGQPLIADGLGHDTIMKWLRVA
ncbi:hypothetical protein EDC04DRAFT_2623142 [Pisolithus marmoratus]|nr:hypothetical protein EDC04DRAFT_2623142 [Pisolithus marmoratus]